MVFKEFGRFWLLPKQVEAECTDEVEGTALLANAAAACWVLRSHRFRHLFPDLRICICPRLARSRAPNGAFPCAPRSLQQFYFVKSAVRRILDFDALSMGASGS